MNYASSGDEFKILTSKKKLIKPLLNVNVHSNIRRNNLTDSDNSSQDFSPSELVKSRLIPRLSGNSLVAGGLQQLPIPGLVAGGLQQLPIPGLNEAIQKAGSFTGGGLVAGGLENLPVPGLDEAIQKARSFTSGLVAGGLVAGGLENLPVPGLDEAIQKARSFTSGLVAGGLVAGGLVAGGLVAGGLQKLPIPGLDEALQKANNFTGGGLVAGGLQKLPIPGLDEALQKANNFTGGGLVAGGLQKLPIPGLDEALQKGNGLVAGGLSDLARSKDPLAERFSSILRGGNLNIDSSPESLEKNRKLADFLDQKLQQVYKEKDGSKKSMKRLFRIDLMVNFIATLIKIGDAYPINEFNDSELLELRKKAYKVFRRALISKLKVDFKHEKERIINSVYNGNDDEVKSLFSNYLLSKYK